MENITYRFLIDAKELFDTSAYKEALNICREGLVKYPRTLSAYSICIDSILNLEGSEVALGFLNSIPQSILNKPAYDIFTNNLKSNILNFKELNEDTIIQEDYINPYEVEDESFKFGNFLDDDAITSDNTDSIDIENESAELQQEFEESNSDDSENLTAPDEQLDFENKISPLHQAEEYLTPDPTSSQDIQDNKDIGLDIEIAEELEYSETPTIDEEKILEDYSQTQQQFDDTPITPNADEDLSTSPPEIEEEEVDILFPISEEIDDISPHFETQESPKDSDTSQNTNIEDAVQEPSPHLFEEELDTNDKDSDEVLL